MSKHDEALEAIYTAVATLAAAAPNYSGTTGSAMLRDAAIAYRAAVGGAQPGSVVVKNG